MDVSTSRLKSSPGLTSGSDRQYVTVWDKLLHTDDRYRKSVLMKTSDANRNVDKLSRPMLFWLYRVSNTVTLSQ